MPDREKVIKSLNKALTRVGCGDIDNVTLSEVEEAIESAIALLREQEATEYVDDGLDSVNGKLATRYKCKFCGQTMTCEFEKSPAEFVTYCIRCGRKVKWDGADGRTLV